jgi:hypothetical protein
MMYEGDTMTDRSDPFWDAVEGRVPLPRAAATLGLEYQVFLEASLLDSDTEVIATATATARVIALSQARSAA